MGAQEYQAITILGNCQGGQLAACLRRMLPNVAIDYVRYFDDADLVAQTSGPETRWFLCSSR